MAKVKRRKKRGPSKLKALFGVVVILAITAALVVVLWRFVGRGGRGAGAAGGGTGDPAAEGGIPLSLFYSCGLEGRLAPYTCEEGELGGVARMATVYADWSKERAQRILVDVGNSVCTAHEAGETVNAFTFSALDKLGYDVVNCGDNEATLSLDELRALSKDRKFKLISANLVRADTQAPIFPTHEIIRRKGRNIAFIGLLREDILPKRSGKGVRLISPAAALKGIVGSIKDTVDLIVVLAFLPVEDIYELARKHPEVQIFIGGLTPVSSPPYEVTGPRNSVTTLVCYLGDQGCTVGYLDASFFKERPPTAEGRVALLDQSVKPDAGFAGLLAEFTAALSGKSLPGAKQDPKMPCTSSHVGSDVCKLCHIKQFYSWQATGHAGAYVTLLQKSKQKEPECLTCHVTGYRMPGGFDPDRPPPAAPPPDKKEPAPAVRAPRTQDPLKGVGCECCHGGCRHHLGIALKDRFAAARTPLLRSTPSLENCIRCHVGSRPCREKGTTEPYDRIEYMERIKHWD